MILFLFLAFFNFLSAENKFTFLHDPIDVVIPCTEKDLSTLSYCITGIKKYGHNVRRVIVVANRRLSERAEWFDEKLFPFSKEDVAFYLCKQDPARTHDYLSHPQPRVGWYYQQLLKFYAPFVIPDISSNVLILDSDTIFLNPVKFLNGDHAGMYHVREDYHEPYFIHAKKLIPNFGKVFEKGGAITHHMLFQRDVLSHLFKTVETHHQTDFWKAFCLCVADEDIYLSGASEYEIYFNYLFSNSKTPRVRSLKTLDVDNLKEMMILKRKGYHAVSCHSYSRH